ncbi:hypothetical protein MRB53_037855 [Persea americana]|nr:hypothetical protein MRB53_037855 [Persea americana]
MPRVASVPNLAEDSRVGSPSPYSVDGAASIAMLEKVIREMASKEGQERLLLTLNELFEKNSKTNAEAARKVEELATFIKERPVATSLVPVSQSASGAPQLDLSFDSPQNKATSRRAVDQPVQTNDEVFKLLQRIKDSISHVGGTSAEVKASIRDMRGEVLGMGRDLGKKLDQVSESQLNNTLDRSIATGQSTQDQSEVYRVLEEGLNEIRDHISNIFDKHSQLMDTRERQITPSQVDKEQMYTVVSHALADHNQAIAPLPQDNLVSNTVLDAVKEGLKDFEPNIELQQFGLERDEILAVLKEGLEDYQRSRSEPTSLGIDKGEIYEMMQEALKDFQPSQAPYDMSRVREETIADVRLALAAFQASAETPQLDHEMIRLAVADAVKEGLVEHGPAAPRELEISREDLFDAVKSSLDGTSIPFNSLGEQVLERLQALVDGLGLEFKQYSAANGRDTEQVLDAIKDGLDSLRVEIEQYVDRAQDVTGKDEIVHTMRSGIEQLRDEMQGLAATATRNDSASSEMLDYLKAEFEHLHEAVGTTRDMREPATDHSISLLQALQSSVDALQDRRRSRGVSIGESDDSREEVFEAMKDEFEQLKTAILHGHATDKSDLIETIQDTLGSLHARLNGSDISSLSSNSADELLSNIRQEFAEVKNSLGSTMDEGDRDVILTGVKRTINDLRVQLAADQSDAAAEAIGAIREELEKFRESMNGQAVSGDIITPVSLAAVELRLENIREQMVKTPMMSGVSEDLLESIRGEFESVRNAINHQPGPHEEVVDIIRVGLDDLRSSLEKKIDSPERQHTQQTELLDVMSEGLETLRADVLKTLDKPLDMTVNYEILDTLKSGLTSLRAEIDGMKPTNSRPDQVVLADGGVIADGSRGLSAANVDASTTSTDKSSTDRVEVMLTQLQIKVEALSASLDDSHHSHTVSANAATREDLESIEASLKDLQETVLVLAEKDVPDSSAPEGCSYQSRYRRN